MTTTYEEGAIHGLDDIQPGIFPFWHRCVLPRRDLFRNQHPAVLTSHSRDGEYIARVIRRLDLCRCAAPVRVAAARAAGDEQTLAEADAVAFTIDGPRGPRHSPREARCCWRG